MKLIKIVAGIGCAGAVVFLSLGPSPARASTTAPPDFVNDPVANFAADVVSEDLQPALEVASNFVGQQTTAAGLQIDLSSAATAAQTVLIADEATKQVASLAKFGIDGSTVTVPISVNVVPNSLATLQGLTSRLDADQAAWAAKGISLSSWGPDITSDSVVVHLQDYTADSAKQITAAYGPLVTVADVSESAAGSSRTADSAPWWGGDKITSGGTYCTSWFSVSSASGAAVSPTSGHCGAGTWLQNGNTFGTVSSTGLIAAHQTGNLVAFSAGDSGGPVETTSGSTQSIAQGMIEARNTGNAAYGWYMPARTVDSYFNVFVKTG